ncbi:Glutamyl-tRNA(Gln) amidotransferase subunit A [compost metagenome]
MDQLFEEYDFVLSPVAPTAAFKIGDNVQDALVMYMADIFTVLPSLSGNPAIALPLGNNEANLPLSIQFTAKHFEEDKLLAFSQAFLK